MPPAIQQTTSAANAQRASAFAYPSPRTDSGAFATGAIRCGAVRIALRSSEQLKIHKQLRKLKYRLQRLLRGGTPEIARRVRAKKLTYLSKRALDDLYYSVRKLEAKDIEGAIIEAGCALGGSAIVLAAAKTPERALYVYDVFGMIPPPSDADGEDVHQRYEEIAAGKSAGIQGDAYYGYEENLLDKVRNSFADCGVPAEQNRVQLVEGLFEDTLRVDGPVALAHIDGDWYQSVMTCLQRIEPHLQPGGSLVIDDYQSWSGCRKAVDEYFADKQEKYRFVMKARLHIVRR
jgi:O-methyltransferase